MSMVTTLLLAAWTLTLATTVVVVARTRMAPAIIGFGERKKGVAHYGKLIAVYQAQQRQAFLLVGSAIAAGIILAIILIGRLITQPVLDIAIVASGVGTVADIGLGAGAMRLYDRTSKRLEAAIRESAGAPPDAE
jgi:hypothetical protein